MAWQQRSWKSQARTGGRIMPVRRFRDMRADKPFRKALLCAIVFTLVCCLFPRRHHSPDFRAAPYFGAGSLAAALVTGILAYFSKDTWSWKNIVATFFIITSILAFACAVTLIFGLKYF